MMRCSSIAIAVGLTGLGLLVSSSGASAATFTVPGYGTYDITVLSTSYNDSTALLQSQPWWGNATEAQTFATTVDNRLGLPNGPVYSPFFAYNINSSFSLINTYAYSINTNSVANVPISGGGAPFSTFTYAVATPITSTVPEPSEILGTLLFSALGASYLLKRQSRQVAYLGVGIINYIKSDLSLNPRSLL